MKANTVEEAGSLVRMLLTDQKKMVLLQNRARDISVRDSSLKIADFVLRSLQ